MEKKRRTVRKLLPVSPFDSQGLENWFSEMAGQGLSAGGCLVLLNRWPVRLLVCSYANDSAFFDAADGVYVWYGYVLAVVRLHSDTKLHKTQAG